MNRKRPARPNWFRIILLCLLVLGGAYMNRFVIATQPSPFVATPTATRAAESFITEADAYFQEGKLLPSIESYQQAVISRPDDPTIRIALARAQVWAGQYEEGKTSAEDALLLNPDNSMAHAVLAWALIFLDDYAGAEDAIMRALQLDPNNGLAHAYYVEILLDSFREGAGSFENVEKAIEESKVAIALAPDTLETHRARGYVYEVTGNYAEAIREYQVASNINPNIADLHLALGGNFVALGDNNEAIQEYTRANALNPQDPTPDLLMSRLYANSGDFVKAQQYAETAVQDNPADTGLRGNLGLMLHENFYYEEAIEQLGFVVNGGVTEDGITLEAIPLQAGNPRLAGYYSTYAFALQKTNQCGQALLIAQMLQARVPEDTTAIENAAEIILLCERNLVRTPGPTSTPVDDEPTETPQPEETATSTP
jgi:tetratricopeptide (TPR) repeat protein